MDNTPYALTELTVVLGTPTHLAAPFAEFQQRAGEGANVTEHAWALHEYAALDALTHRDGSIKTHTILETILSSVLGADVIVLDVDRRWVRAEDGHLYTALSICTEDIRSRADVGSLSGPRFLEALTADALYLGALDLSLMRHRLAGENAVGLAFLYLGKQRADLLKQSGEITPRFRREIVAKTFMTSCALERLAPRLSGELFAFMRG